MYKTLLRNLSQQELENWITQQYQQPRFRATQLYQWLWRKNIKNLDEITNIPKYLIQNLKEQVIWDIIELNTFQKSSDSTIKAAFILYDKLMIEGVIIPSSNRVTACISTQVGCPVKCSFCATGQMGFIRNLTVGEIIDQVVFLNRLSKQELSKELTNIVIMGMGEPLLNYENTLKAIGILVSPTLMNWSKYRITLSSIGIPEKITQFAHDNPGIKLAISLHSPFQEKREQIIPLAKKYKLQDLLKSLKYYVKQTNREVTFEYLMLHNFNDTIDDAKELLKICSTIKSKINLIQYNIVEGLPFNTSSQEKIADFYNFFKNKNINIRIRKSHGHDINAACGQLANKLFKK